jgi:hypothetical protein
MLLVVVAEIGRKYLRQVLQGQKKWLFSRVLMMMYDTRNYWVFGLCPMASIQKNRENNASPSTGEGETPILFESLRYC